MTEGEYDKACSMAYGIGRYMGDPSAERDIAAVAKEARLQTLRAEMLEAAIKLEHAERVIERACRNEYEMESPSELAAMVTAREAYSEAKMAWMLMGGRP